MNKSPLLVFAFILVLSITGCGASTQGNQKTSVNNESNTVEEADEISSPDAAVEMDVSDMFSGRDYEVGYDASESALIQLNGTTAACGSDAVQISESAITITDGGTYILSGSLDDGMVIVNAKDTDKLQLVLDNVSIHSETFAPIYILEADKVVVTLAEDSENTLSNGGFFTAIDDNNVDGCIFSKQDLSLNGSGSLTVVSPAGHGIVCKDDLVFTSGTYDITAASHGIDANDSVRTTNAELTITSGKDGIHAENSDDASLGFIYIVDGSFHITAEGDGISAGANLLIEDGSFAITSGGGSANAQQHTTDFGGGGGMRGGRGRMNEDSRPEEDSEKAQGEASSGNPPEASSGGPTEALPEGSSEPPTEALPEGSLEPPSETFPKGSSEPPSGALSEASSETLTETDDSVSGDSMKGIKAAADLVVHNGVFVMDTADDSVHSNTSVTISGGNFEIASGDDAVHADETLAVTAGTIHVTESYEGLEGLYVDISGGNITISASDDGINAAGGTDQSGMGGHRGGDSFGGGKGGSNSSGSGSIHISDGTITVYASGDGLDANGTLEISGGMVTVSCPVSGDTSVLDYDVSGEITGGVFIGTGAARMAQTLQSATQGVIDINESAQFDGGKITLTDKNGNEILSYEADQSFDFAVFSSPDLVKGETYTVTVGASSQEYTAS